MLRSLEIHDFAVLFYLFLLAERNNRQISSNPYENCNEGNDEKEEEKGVIECNDAFQLAAAIRDGKVEQRQIMKKDVTSRTSWINRYIDLFYDVTGHKPKKLRGWYKCTFKNCAFLRKIDQVAIGGHDLERHLVNQHKDFNLNKTKFQINPSKKIDDNYEIVMKRTHFEEFVSSVLNIGFAFGGLETETISELLPEKQCEFNWEKLLEEIQAKAQEEGKYP